MSRLALAATRAAKLLNFLAAHPTEGFTLSELSERLGVNVASMHALLASLTEDGYLVRHPRQKTFTLGPAVIALGTAALETHPAVDLARDAARQLAKDTGLEVALTTLGGEDQILFLARVGGPTARGIPIHVGQRMPFEPPLGAVFLAWGDAEAWLAKSDEPDRLRTVLEGVRARGYSVSLEVEARTRLGHALDQLASAPLDGERRESVGHLVRDLGGRPYHALEINAATTYDVSLIAAPVFGPAGEVVLALTLIGFPLGLSGAQVTEFADALRDTALVVTKKARGRIPSTDG